MKHENQHDYVRAQLSATPRADWIDVAASAGLSVRTLYHLADPTRNAHYATVFSLYAVLKDRAAKKGKN